MATVIDKEWRKKEPSLQDIIKKYPTVSPFIIIQIDVQRRGVHYTDRALEKLDTNIHKVTTSKNKQGEVRVTPASFLLRDGTSVIVSETSTQTHREPYTIDVVDNKIVLVDQDNVIEEVEYWEKPKYFDKFTSRGTPMSEVVDARPQRFSVTMSRYCHFW